MRTPTLSQFDKGALTARQKLATGKPLGWLLVDVMSDNVEQFAEYADGWNSVAISARDETNCTPASVGFDSKGMSSTPL